MVQGTGTGDNMKPTSYYPGLIQNNIKQPYKKTVTKEYDSEGKCIKETIVEEYYSQPTITY